MPRTSEATLAAIKHAVDIVALVGESLTVTRAGSKFKALCPFHDDHNPSMELNPDRQSYKCWSCGAGGDVFDFVMNHERIEFPEALRMLAERAGITLDAPASAEAAPAGISKTELLAVNAWAESAFAEALGRSEQAREYLASRGIVGESVSRFKLGYAPGERNWLPSRAKREGFPVDLLEKAGLVVRPADAPGQVRDRFRGRVIFPIHDPKGRAIGFGGRVLPEVERLLAASGKRTAKYLNSPETPLFKKRQVLYAGDLARAAAREAGWVAVVEGYTDVIAAHQVGLCNVVGTLGTALGDDHVVALRRLADRVVLIFDGDDAGQNAADRSLELFLAHEVD
ncbi:MAG: DNA primase, partial [Planctomycetia bacterium]|nr:DNA primase [Planctomycetia bacterium]